MSDDLNNFTAMEADIDRNLAETEEYIRNLEATEEEQPGPFEPMSPLNQATPSSTESPAVPRIQIRTPSTARRAPPPPPPRGTTATRSNLRPATSVQVNRPQPTQRATFRNTSQPTQQNQQVITVGGRRLIVSPTVSAVTEGTTAF